MNKIDTSRWEKFKLSDLFDIVLSNDDLQPKKLAIGTIPLISSGKTNNGIVAFIPEDTVAKLFAGNSITVDMFGKAFYQPKPFFAVSHGRVNILIPKFTMTEQIGKVIVAIFEAKTTGVFSFDEMCNKAQLKKLSLLLPATETGEPDWRYMEDYMKAIEQKANKNLLSLHSNKEKQKIDTTEWKEFQIQDLFEVETSPSINKQQFEFSDDGEYEFVGRTGVNNGVQGKTHKLTFQPNKSNTFSVVQIGERVCLYRPTQWYASQNIFVLSPKYPNADKTAHFISCLISRMLLSVYGTETYASYPTLKKLKENSIILPTGIDGSPDWEYMENYMKAIEQKAKNKLKRFETGE